MKIFLPFLFLCLFAASNSYSQTFSVNAPYGYEPPKTYPVTQVFFNPTDSIILIWNGKYFSQSNVYLRIGTSPGNYNLTQLNVSGSRTGFIPGNAPLNLSTGRYYGIITNSSQTSLSGIRNDWQANQGSIDFSNEIQFIVQSTVAPYAIAPRGIVSNATPVFQWNPVPGVPAYWIICSSTPFVVSTDSNNNISISNLNILWDYVTTGTSATYGQISPNSPFTQTAIPLFPNNEYNYTVLNLYDPTDISFASAVFGGAVSFTLQASNTILPPNLISPADKAVFSGDPIIRFQWDQVANANTYTFHLFNRVTQFAGNNQEIDVPIWTTSTTNTMIDFPAKTNLLQGKYSWFVVPNSNSGAGSVSSTRLFNYNVPMGKFRVRLLSADDNSQLMNFQYQVTSTSGGYSPSIPYVVTNSSSYTDSLPVDIYHFTVQKPGFFDSTFTIQIIASQSISDFPLYLRAFPVTVSGSVKDQANNPVAAANVRFTNLLNSSAFSKATSSDGTFSLVIPKGNYSVSADKPGYLNPAVVSITADSGQVVLNPFILVFDNASVSGKVINDNNESVQLASLTAKNGSITQQSNSDGSGNYSFNLSSGQWTVDVAKDGFISPVSKVFNLAPGDNITNQNLQLIPRANQVTGFIYKLVTNSQGQTSTVPFTGVTVTASPGAGQPVTTVSNPSGQYTLSLRNGSFIINASQASYSSGNPVQLTLNIAQTISGIDFTLTPNPSSVSWFVTDPNGQPIEGAAVSVQNVGTINSLSSGSYSLSLPSGSFSLNAIKQGYVSPQPTVINLNPGQTLSGINFQLLTNAGVVSGKVLSAGQPLYNAVVTAVNGNSSVPTYTNQTGDYTLNLQPGQWNIHVSKQGFITTTDLVITIGPGQTSQNNNFNVVQNSASITGLVTNGSNLINNAQVSITDVNNPQGTVSSVTDINGQFSLTVEAGKSYNLSIIKTGYIAQSVITGILAPASSVNYNFNITANPSSFAGKVYSNLQVPLPQVKVFLTNSQSGNILDSTLTDVNGNYTLGVSAGAYKIVAVKPGYTSDNITLQINIGDNLTAVNFTLIENFALLTGNITDNSGVGIAGVLINLTSQNGGATSTTSQTGDYIISKLLGSIYSISVSKSGYSDTLISNYKILDGESKTVNVSLRKLLGKISGNITDNNKNAVPQANVNAKDNSNNIFSAITDNNGNYLISSLGLGVFTVTSSKSGYQSSQQIIDTISLSSLNQTASINDFSLNKSKVTGIVKDNSSNPLLQAQINISGLVGSASTVSGNDGSFAILNLAKGNYNLLCSKTGYSTFSDSGITVTDSISIPVVLNLNNSTIKGYVKNQFNNPLPFSVPLMAVSNQKSNYQTTTDLNGYFEFTNVGSNSSYTISTQIFKEGINNDTIFNVNVPLSQLVVGPVTLSVKVNNSFVKGTVGTPSALIKLTNLSTNEIKNVSSSSNGSYQFGFLPGGSYQIAPGKSGFVFTPGLQNFTLGDPDSVTVNFQCSSDVGNILVTSLDNNGNPVSGVTVTAINYSANLILSGTTNNSGVYQFTDISSGSYSIKLTMSGYSISPDSAVTTVTNGVTSSKFFIIKRNSGSVSGIINQFVNSSLSLSPDANIVLRNLGSGQSFNTKTISDGTYSIANLDSGYYQIKASKVGFSTDSLQFYLAVGEVKSLSLLTMKASFVGLTGKVVYNNIGVPNVIVNAISSSVLTDTTDINGNFSFNNAQIKPLSTDTTIYQIVISKSGLSPQSKILPIPGSAIGSIISVPPFVLPSGQIYLSFSDKLNAVSGLKITLSYPNGQVVGSVTGTDGRFISDSVLFAGAYKISLVKQNILIPDDSSLTFILASDTTKINRTINLPYWHNAVTSISPVKPNYIKAYFNVKPSNTAGVLFYKQGTSLSYLQSAMTLDSCFTGIIPALNSRDSVSYYIIVTDNSSNIKYKSDTYTVIPTSEGILNSISVTPDLGNTSLRKGDVINLALTIRDGINNDLSGLFIGTNPAGHISWQLSNPLAGNFTFPVTNDSTHANLVTNLEGGFNLIVTGKLYGVNIVTTFNITISNPVIKQISVNSPASSLSNKSNGIQFSYTAVDTMKKSIYLGNSVLWSVAPSLSGTITQTGFFTPVDSTYIGIITVTAQDQVTNFKGSNDLSVFATINPSTNITLTDKSGMNLSIKSGSVNNITNITMSKPQFGPGKKTFIPLDQNGTFNISDKQYQIVYNSDLGLPGDSLMQPAELELPLDNSLRFFDGTKSIAIYDYVQNKWLLKPTVAGSDNSVATNMVYHFGEYAILSLNEPLGLKYVSILPSPFSPQVAPVKIGYFLSTNSPPAFVTIKIFNIRGELVRTILDSSPQNPGVYGGRKGLAQIEWNGKTNNGLIANNGRYIIQITAKDVTGDVSELKQVVLIK
jgi:hypothetical protein